MKYTIVSDWHIGSEVCQRDKILQLLKTMDTEVLILNGDIIDIDHVKRLAKKDWKILGQLRKLSKHTRVIYLPGNHDFSVYELISELLGLEHYQSFDFELCGQRYHITHGHLFDSFITKHWLLTEIASGLYYWIQRISTKAQLLARNLKQRSKRFINCCEELKYRATKYAEHHNYDYIIIGHTHSPELLPGQRYINTGCFTEIACSYLEITTDGKHNLRIT